MNKKEKPVSSWALQLIVMNWDYFILNNETMILFNKYTDSTESFFIYQFIGLF